MINMAEKNNLKIFDLKSNDINGGILSILFVRKMLILELIIKLLKNVKRKTIGVSKFKTIVNFYKKIKQKNFYY